MTFTKEFNIANSSVFSLATKPITNYKCLNCGFTTTTMLSICPKCKEQNAKWQFGEGKKK